MFLPLSYLAIELPILLDELYVTILGSYPYSEIIKKEILIFRLKKLSNNSKRAFSELNQKINNYYYKETFFQNILNDFESKVLLPSQITLEFEDDINTLINLLKNFYSECKNLSLLTEDAILKIIKENKLTDASGKNLLSDEKIEKLKNKNLNLWLTLDLVRTKSFILKNICNLLEQVDYLDRKIQ